MAQSYLNVDKVAEILGVSPDEVNQLREGRQLYGYRDGASWKFKAEDVEKLAKDRAEGKTGDEEEDDADVLLSEYALGQSAPSTTGSVLGMAPDAEPGSSDIQLAAASDIQLADSQLKLGSGTGLPAGSSKTGKSDSKAGKSDSKVTKPDSRPRGDSQVNLGDDLTLGSSMATMKGPPKPKGGSDLDLTAAGEGVSDDELVLGGSSGVGSDVALGGDSGISLVDPADSGLSLEEPLDLAAAGDESLELGEDDMISLADEQVDHESPTQLKSDDDFLLTPAKEAGDEEEDSESGSQVIALDNEGSVDEAATTSHVPRGGAVAMLEEDLSTAGLGMGAAADAGMGPAGMGGMPSDLTAAVPMIAPALPEAPYSVLQVLSLALCVFLLAVGGMMICDLVRSMGSWDGPYQINSSLMDTVLSFIER
jgi:hypothetical protein